MTILKDVVSELIGMFVGDARLSGAVLAVVAAAAGAHSAGSLHPLVGGAILLLGCLLLLIAAVYLTARRHWTAQLPRSRQEI